MNPSHDQLSPSEIAPQLYEAEQFLDGLFPQTADEVLETLAMFGTTPVELPERLREPDAVFDRMIEKQQAQHEPSAFGTLLTMLRTEKRLSIEQLATKTDLDADDLRQIETVPGAVASPLTVSTIADYFKLEPRKLIRLAGLTSNAKIPVHQDALSVAACAKPNFDALTPKEKACLYALVKKLREKGE